MSNPAAPILKSATDLNYGVPDDGIFVSGNYAYIAEGAGTTNAFQIFDVSNPSAPVLTGQADLANAGTIDTGGGDAIWVRDGFAYIVEGGDDQRVRDIRRLEPGHSFARKPEPACLQRPAGRHLRLGEIRLHR